MSKTSFLQLGEDKKGFEIVAGSGLIGLPDNVSGEMLWNLWDIGTKFGQEIHKGLGFKAEPLVLELYDFRNNGAGGKAGFTVGKVRGTCLMNEGIFMFDLKNGMSVIWDKGLKAKDISDVIKEIDEYSISCGYIENGIRIALFNPSKGSDGKMSVEHVFAESAIMMVLPGDLEGTLEGFDHPELLVAIEMGALKLLCLATEKDAIVASMEAKILKLKEMGISPEKVANMEAEEIIELRELLKLI